MLFSQIIPPLLFPHSPKVCSLHLCLFFCLAYRVVITIFLNSRFLKILESYCPWKLLNHHSSTGEKFCQSREHVGEPAAAAKSLQSCPTLCNPIVGSPPGSLVPGILQARTLEWVAISFSNAWKWKVKVKSLSRVRLLATPWTAAYQAPSSMGFSRQEYWSGVPLPSPRDM